ncbi:hypothetical protein LP420_08980 [Massilia sp. B-10]|nr:hypothetical protein LP420_08980 [Massilia sp. B-10]
MHTPIKPISLAAALVFGVFAAQAATAQSNVVTEQRQLGAFKAIELSGPYQVVIKAQGTQSVSLSGPKDKLAEVETRSAATP